MRALILFLLFSCSQAFSYDGQEDYHRLPFDQWGLIDFAKEQGEKWLTKAEESMFVPIKCADIKNVCRSEKRDLQGRITKITFLVKLNDNSEATSTFSVPSSIDTYTTGVPLSGYLKESTHDRRQFFVISHFYQEQERRKLERPQIENN